MRLILGFMNSSFRGYLAAFCSCALWSCNIIASKHLSVAGISPIAISLWRWLIAALVLGLLYFRSIVNYRQVVWQNKWFFVILAVLGVSLANTLLYYAAYSTGAINMGLLSATGPLFILLFSCWILRESLQLRKIIGSGIAICGILLLITHGNLWQLSAVHFAIGDILMLLMLASVGIFTVLSKKQPDGMPSSVFLFYAFVIGVLPIIPAYFMVETRAVADYSLADWGELLFLGMGPSLIAFVTWNYAIQKLGPSVVGIIYFSVPVFVALLAVFGLGEEFAWYHLVGMGILAIGVGYSVWEGDKTRGRKS